MTRNSMKSFLSLILLSAILLTGSPLPAARAAEGADADSAGQRLLSWEVTGPFGGDVRSLVIDPKDQRRLFLGTIDGQIYTSGDGGESWSRVEVTRGADVDLKLAGVRFADRGHGWVFGELGALFATRDGGATWERQRVPTRHLLLGATFLDAQTGWLVGAGPAVLHTDDGGATWREGDVNAALRPRAARGVRVNAVSFASARRGWAVGSGGLVLATADGGRTWREQLSGTESNLFDVKFFDEREGWAVGAGGVAIHTTDGGATWRAERTGTPHALERLFFVGRARGWAVGFGGTVVAFKG